MFWTRKIYRSKDEATPLKGERSLKEVWESHGRAAPRSPASLYPLHSTGVNKAAAGRAPALVTEVWVQGRRPVQTPCAPVTHALPHRKGKGAGKCGISTLQKMHIGAIAPY